ncbi:MAG: DUF4255 domain-containing protein [Candidatus Accumulibacter meliphilus]|jgi:hypothetical protein|uniref:DUF4255 domain-containing protein n=1 Tax=Candidatus Accumulibacter meliphilus TaxID=2211374 RepID=UPI002FC3DE1D
MAPKRAITEGLLISLLAIMIAEAIKFLRGRLNATLPRESSGVPVEDLFVYAGTGNDERVVFKADAVSLALVRIGEETALRQPDHYATVSADGVRQRVEPEIRLNLFVLFVARFPDDYSLSLHHLSRVIRYFQNHRVFNHQNSPDLHPDIPQLVLELVAPSFSEQNEIWGALRTAYQPSALYKVRLVVFRDEDAQPLATIQEVLPTTVGKVPSP